MRKCRRVGYTSASCGLRHEWGAHGAAAILREKGMIEIEFNLRLAENRDGLQRLDISEPINLRQLETRLGLKKGDVGILLLNGAWARLDSLIKDGDRVQLYPYMEGG